jgi:hypothetical protein
MASDQVRLVTMSASYGAGGSVVAPAVAERLGVPFLHRVTTSTGSIGKREPCTERLAPEEAHVTPVHRLLASFTQAMPAGPTQLPLSARQQDEDLRGRCEEGIRAAGAGVILGWGAAVVFGKDRGFHVRLDGPPARRIVQGAAIEGISREQARRRLDEADQARTAYLRRLYRADAADARYYHLVIDSTAIPLDTIIEIIVQAPSSCSGMLGLRAQPGARHPVRRWA